MPTLKGENRSGASIPTEEQHASCELRECNFFAVDPSSTPRLKANAAWIETSVAGDGTKYVVYRTEEDIVTCVRNYMSSIIQALNLDIRLSGEIGIKHIRPDICAVTSNGHIVGVIEIKLPAKGKSKQPVLNHPNVLGELYDQMQLVRGFYGTGPVIGILTTGVEWKVCWFPEDDEIYKTSAGNVQFHTPLKARAEEGRSSPPGGTPSQEKGVVYGIDAENNEQAEEKEAELGTIPNRCLSSTEIFNAYDNGTELLAVLCSALRRMECARVGFYHSKSAMCLFKLTKGQACISWHPSSYEEAVARVNFNRYPQSKTATLLALEDLGRGSFGRCWLCITTSAANAGVCVLKYRNKAEHERLL
jgi:hypothetical protein